MSSTKSRAALTAALAGLMVAAWSAPAAFGAANDISINDVGLTEGNFGTASAIFTVSRETPNIAANVNFQVDDGDGLVGPDPATLADNDYIDQGGTLMFTPAEATETIAVPIVGDLKDEFDETYIVALTSTTAGTIVGSVGVGTINDNDPAPTLSIADQSVVEPDAGTSPATIIVSLSAVSGKTVGFNISTTDVTATQPSDYLAPAAGPYFANPGEATESVPVSIVGDTLVEPDESFLVTLSSPTNAAIADSFATGTILNNDSAPAAALPPTGQRAAALKKCKRKKSKRVRTKCKRRARRLPV